MMPLSTLVFIYLYLCCRTFLHHIQNGSIIVILRLFYDNFHLEIISFYYLIYLPKHYFTSKCSLMFTLFAKHSLKEAEIYLFSYSHFVHETCFHYITVMQLIKFYKIKHQEKYM